MGCLAKDAVEGAGDEQPGDTKSSTHQGCSDRRVAGFFGEQQQSMHCGGLDPHSCSRSQGGSRSHGPPSILLQHVGQEHFFDKPLEIIYDNVCAAVKAHASEFTILCVDKEGIWTSMTFAKIVAEIAVSCRQFLLQGVTVLTPTDAVPCSQCDRCKFWDRRWVAKHEGINHAVQKWEGLMQGKRLCK